MSRQYLSAGNIVGEVDLGKSFKAHCASMNSIGKVDYALAAETLKYKEVLESIFEKCGVSASALEVKNGVLLVMSYELLFGSGKINGGGVVKRKIMEHLPQMKNCLAEMMIGKSDTIELLSKSVQESSLLPKYIRINTTKLNISEGLEYLQTFYPEAVLDKFVPSLVVLPANSKGFGQNEYVLDGRLIIQDKASCFPSQILANHYLHAVKNSTDTHKPASTTNKSINANKKNKAGDTTLTDATIGNGSDADFLSGGNFIDACAAPGNKTSHLASEIIAHIRDQSGNNGKNNKSKSNNSNNNTLPTIYALDKSKVRSELLLSRMQQSGVDIIVNVRNTDFLSLDVNSPEYSTVTSILLDPSCSGSGVVRAVERVHEGDENNIETDTGRNRIDKLRNFQIMAIRKAMSFPQIQRIVYSTCSVHEQENELVVGQVLNNPIVVDSSNDKLDSKKQDNALPPLNADWQVVPPLGFETWTRRGHSVPSLSAQQSKCLIRCSPEDGMNGFFVAMFERKTDSTARYNNINLQLHSATNSSFPVSNGSENKKRKADKHNHNNNDNGENAWNNKKSKQNTDPYTAAAANGIIPRNQRPKTAGLVIPSVSGNNSSGCKGNNNNNSNNNGSSSAGGSLFGKRFTVSKTTKRKMGKK